MALMAACAGIYVQTLRFDFVNYDDWHYVLHNARVQGGLTLDNFRWAFTTFYFSNWHPLTWLSYMLDVQVFGWGPRGHHLINVVLHTANCWLIYVVLSRMTSNVWRSAVVALFFAVHPLHVESVAWISERKDVLSTFFMLLSLWHYDRYVRKPGWARYIVMSLFFGLALLSKPMVVTLPVLMLLLDFWPYSRFAGVSAGNRDDVPRFRPLKLLFEKIPLLVISAASSLVTYLAQMESGSVLTTLEVPVTARIFNAVNSLVLYLAKTLIPAKLGVLYPYPEGGAAGYALASSVLLVLLAIVAFRHVRQYPYLLFGFLWFLASLLPVLGLIQVGFQAMADRYTYIPHIGLFIAIVWLASDLRVRFRVPVRATVVIVLALFTVLAGVSFRQVGFWKDSRTLWERTLSVTRDNAIAHGIFGKYLIVSGELDEAREHFTSALSVNPVYDDALIAMGDLLTRKGDFTAAAEYLSRTIDLYPENPLPYFMMAIMEDKRGNFREGVSHYEAALRLRPFWVEAHYNMALDLKSLGEVDHATQRLQYVLQLRPDHAGAHLNLGDILAGSGDTRAALRHYETAAALAPSSREATSRLRALRTRMGNTL